MTHLGNRLCIAAIKTTLVARLATSNRGPAAMLHDDHECDHDTSLRVPVGPGQAAHGGPVRKAFKQGRGGERDGGMASEYT